MERRKKRTRIKVCGINTAEDALAAISLGVDALGFIFVESSPRYISPEKAREITETLPPFIHLVGVFLDQDPVEIDEISRYCDLTTIQLHGRENPEYCRALKKTVAPCRVIKAFRVGSRSQKDDFAAYDESVDGFLLDTYVEGQEGGTGEVFDWSVIQRLELKKPLILAGGLTPDNVKNAVVSVRPYSLDVNSGVELSPGVKDPEKIRVLIENVNAADLSSGDNESSGVSVL